MDELEQALDRRRSAPSAGRFERRRLRGLRWALHALAAPLRRPALRACARCAAPARRRAARRPDVPASTRSAISAAFRRTRSPARGGPAALASSRRCGLASARPPARPGLRRRPPHGWPPARPAGERSAPTSPTRRAPTPGQRRAGGQADARALPFRGGTFDAVTLVNVLDHTMRPLRGRPEAARVLRPGGLLILRVPNAAFHRAVGAAPRPPRPAGALAQLGRLPDPPPLRVLARALRRLVEGDGFDVMALRNSALAARAPVPRARGGTAAGRGCCDGHRAPAAARRRGLGRPLARRPVDRALRAPARRGARRDPRQPRDHAAHRRRLVREHRARRSRSCSAPAMPPRWCWDRSPSAGSRTPAGAGVASSSSTTLGAGGEPAPRSAPSLAALPAVPPRAPRHRAHAHVEGGIRGRSRGAAGRRAGGHPSAARPHLLRLLEPARRPPCSSAGADRRALDRHDGRADAARDRGAPGRAASAGAEQYAVVPSGCRPPRCGKARPRAAEARARLGLATTPSW